MFKAPKFRNKKIKVNDLTFDSKKEFERYLFLKKAEENGEITNLQRQVRFELIPAIKTTETTQLKTKSKVVEKVVQKATYYFCDFQYEKDGEIITEDVKISPKMLPKDYRLKEKLMLWRYNIKIKRVYKPNEKL